MSDGIEFPIVINLFGAHRAQDEAARRLQIAIMGGETGRARDLLARLDAKLRRHFRYEEQLLLPELEARVGTDAARGASELICVEHRWVEGYLDQAKDMLRQLGDPDAGQVGRLLALMDALARMIHILEHHDRREADAFDPALDVIFTEAERREILTMIGGFEVEAHREESAWVLGDDAVQLHRLRDRELAPVPASTLEDLLDEATRLVRLLRYVIASDDAARLHSTLTVFGDVLGSLAEEAKAFAANEGDDRFSKLVHGQHDKMAAFVDRARAHVQQALQAATDEGRRDALIDAFVRTTSLAGLLDNHQGAVLRRLEPEQPAAR